MSNEEVKSLVFLNRVCSAVISLSTIIRGKVTAVDYKGSRENYATNIDIAVEQALKIELGELMPEAKMLSEETCNGTEDLSNEYAWVVDPINGTANLRHGLPHFVVSVGLMYNYRPVLGVVWDVNADTLYYGAEGIGSYCSSRKIRVSENPLGNCIAAVGVNAYNKPMSQEIFEKNRQLFLKCEDIRIYGSAALSLCLVAAGKLDLVHYTQLAPWEYCAGLAILHQAGGVSSSDLRKQKSEVFGANNNSNLEEMYHIFRDR